ncbi:MAG: VCBS repeat-containing protein, partial [Chitinophagia bacterium]|nr:VCBS repeat-containing protein [Chitinophagia bacterium]
MNAPGSGASDLIAGDLDNDGLADLVVTNYFSGFISTFQNTSSGGSASFGAPSSFTTGNSPIGLALADYNGDKMLDIVVSNNGASSLSVLRNTSTGGAINFGLRYNVNVGSGPTTVTTGDLNGDNYADLVVGNSSSGTISICQNNPVPRIFNIDGPSAVCPSATITLSDTVGGGKWTSSNPLNATIDSVTGVVTGIATGSTTITYTITVGGISNYRTKTITINALPTPGTISGVAHMCPSDTTTFTNTGSTGGPGTWSSSNTAVASIESSTGLIHSGVLGTAYITYTVTSSLGCGTADTVDTIQVTLPVSGTITGTTTFCAGTISSLVSSGGDAGGIWSSSDTTIAQVNAATGAVTGISGGAVIISYTVSTTCGTSTDTALLNILPYPDAGVITGASSVCLSTSTTLADTATGGTWSSSAPTVASVSSAGAVFGTVEAVKT